MAEKDTEPHNDGIAERELPWDGVSVAEGVPLIDPVLLPLATPPVADPLAVRELLEV